MALYCRAMRVTTQALSAICLSLSLSSSSSLLLYTNCVMLMLLTTLWVVIAESGSRCLRDSDFSFSFPFFFFFLAVFDLVHHPGLGVKSAAVTARSHFWGGVLALTAMLESLLLFSSLLPSVHCFGSWVWGCCCRGDINRPISFFRRKALEASSAAASDRSCRVGLIWSRCFQTAAFNCWSRCCAWLKLDTPYPSFLRYRGSVSPWSRPSVAFSLAWQH